MAPRCTLPSDESWRRDVPECPAAGGRTRKDEGGCHRFSEEAAATTPRGSFLDSPEGRGRLALALWCAGQCGSLDLARC